MSLGHFPIGGAPISDPGIVPAVSGGFLAAWALGSNVLESGVRYMQKNVAGQKIGAQLVSASDGSAFTGAVTVSVTIDAGTQATGSVGSGACTHEGNGYHTYAPAQAETNGTLIAFTFTGPGAVPVTVQVFTTGYDPTLANLPANVTQVSGDSTAADNLESYLDGSEFMPVDTYQQEVTITGTTLQPKKPDGTTNTGYSRTLGTDENALPIISST